MQRDLDLELFAVSYFWDSGRYVLNQWRDESSDVLNDCMIFEVRDRLFVGIEDDEFYYALKTRMRKEGVPIVRELPPGVSIFEQAINDLISIGMGIDELNDVFDELKKMQESNMSREAMEKRLAEIKTRFCDEEHKGTEHQK